MGDREPTEIRCRIGGFTRKQARHQLLVQGRGREGYRPNKSPGPVAAGPSADQPPPAPSRGGRRVLNAEAAGVGRGKASAEGEPTTVTASVELLWNVLETAKGNKEPGPDGLRKVEEAVGAHPTG